MWPRSSIPSMSINANNTIIDQAAERWFLRQPESDPVDALWKVTNVPVYGYVPEQNGLALSSAPFPDYTTLFRTFCLKG